MKQYLHLFFSLIVGVIFSSSCQDESFIPENSSNNKSITLTLSLPGDTDTSSTRAMSEEDEKQIDTLHVLAFLYDNASNDYIYAYKTTGNDATPSGNNITFQVELKAYEAPQRFLVIANVSNELTNANLQNLTIEDAIETLTFQNVNEWTNRSIPMYGITNPISLTTSTSSLEVLSMVRMLARIDIKRAHTVTNFKLVTACLFNRKDRGYIGYRDENWDNTHKKVFSADVPSGTVTTKLPSIHFEADDNNIIRSIYTFETKGTDSSQDATAVVMGGYFNYPENSDKITYYRIDIPKIEGGRPQDGTMGDILRNYLYEINITGVSKEGAETPEEAFDGGITIEAAIEPWNLMTNTIIFEDAQYKLTLNKTSLVFPKEATTLELEYSTDHPNGITYTSTITTWATIVNISQNNLSGTLQITTRPTTTARSGVIRLKIGNMTHEFPISQKSTSWLDWTNHQTYYINGKNYNTANGNAPKITSLVDWYATIEDENNILLSENFHFGGIANSGTEDYAFSIKENSDVNLFHTATITFHSKSGDLSKSYPIINKEGACNSVANCIIANPNSLVNIPSAYRKAFAIWKHGDEVSGSLGDISDFGNISAKVVWQDKPDVINNNIHVLNDEGRTIQFSPTGVGNAVVALYAGNAIVWSWHVWVVDPTNPPVEAGGAGVYNRPALNRNIGAMSSEEGNPESMGLLYQWGRKDPFLSLSDFNVSAPPRKVYNKEGLEITENLLLSSYYSTQSVDKNLVNAIQNPFTFYKNWYTFRDAFVQYTNTYLWESLLGEKNIFDPCPNGYRVPTENTHGEYPYLNVRDESDEFSNYGRIYPSYGGFHPANGYREETSFYEVGTSGPYWLGFSMYSSNHRGRVFNFNMLHTSQAFSTYSLNRALSVRCTKDIF